MGLFGLIYMLFIGLFIVYMSYALRAYLPLWGWFLAIFNFFGSIKRRWFTRTAYVRQRTVEEVLFGDDDDEDSVITQDNLVVLPTPQERRVLAYVAENPGLTARQISEGAGMGVSTVRKTLRGLHDSEKVARTGEGNVQSPYVWSSI